MREREREREIQEGRGEHVVSFRVYVSLIYIQYIVSSSSNLVVVVFTSFIFIVFITVLVLNSSQ